jgi:hypothetical protein
MAREFTLQKEITLNGTKSGKIRVGELTEPYGKESEAVVSIAISLSENDSDWKIHIPYSNLDEVIQALQEMKK